MKRVIFFLLVAISAYSQTYNPNLLSCTLSVEKDTFLLDEPIFIEFKETNIGQTDVMTNRFFFDIKESYSATLIGPDGKEIKRGGGHGDRPYDRPEEGYLLKPGESQYYVFMLNNYYGYPDLRPEAWTSAYLPTGRYRYKITHYTNANYMYEYLQELKKPENHRQLNSPGFQKKLMDSIDKMSVTSNEIVFYVVDPDAEQNEDRLAFMRCFKQQRRGEKNNQFLYELIKNYLNKYRNSRYNYKYKIFDLYCVIEPSDILWNLITPKEILELSKDSYYANNISGFGFAVHKDLQTDKRRFTPVIENNKRLMEEYPNTQLAKYAEFKVSDNEWFRVKWIKEGKEE